MLLLTTPVLLRGVTRELHITRSARERFNVDESLLCSRGTLLFVDVGAADRLAAAMNEKRDVRRFPEMTVRSGELLAAGLLHEIQHLLIGRVREGDPKALASVLTLAEGELGAEKLGRLLLAFAEEFPSRSVQNGGMSAEQYLAGDEEGVPNREVVLEELLLLALANRNPALERFRELFIDSALRDHEGYPDLLERSGRKLPGIVPDGATGTAGVGLLELLEEPLKASPTSLEGQLEYVRRNWQPLLGEQLEALLDRLLLSLDLMAEERKIGLIGPPAEVPPPTLEELRGPGREESVNFSADASWMPRLVLLAKSTYVWLDQLSRRFERTVERLDQIPDEALDEIAQRGFTGLWLIGLWERSEASRRIKHLRGQSDAVASAYALYDYRIAQDLGGEEAYQNLRDRAWHKGIRLASDMVPNHVGIDGRWVVEHPDWFVQLDHTPYPSYSFQGPDLSTDERVGIYLEDHYYDNSDAAVVFKRVDRRTGEERFIYHGNDGTAMPWNDTAQLDYLNPRVREAVIDTIVEVARKFPIIRFDAAMTLAKQHIQRLWYPQPGHGGAIPSRARYGSMPADEFERAIPEEFWREVVDRVARDAPNTLLLAEAFWMMEGYFVRTLGMHRVYNSAFMNMLKREANGEFRQLIRNVLEFEPQVLQRFVNFMNNPDEDSAVAQFGKDDKYFGVCTLMCTLPGLPMFGHGQVEGYEEKYGMEFRRARRDELPDPWLIERHQREIFPLLHRRAQFADANGFRLYDFTSTDGTVNEDVIAYSNLGDGAASLVVFNNRFSETTGRIRTSVASASPDSGNTLFHGLGLEGGSERFVVYRDHASGLEYIERSDRLRDEGMELHLTAFAYRVFLDFREVRDSEEEPYADLWHELSGRGVPSIHDALLDHALRPVLDALGDLLDTPFLDREPLLASYRDLLDSLDEFGLEWQRPRRRAEKEFEALHSAAEAVARATPSLARKLDELSLPLLGWMILATLPEGAFGRYRLEQEFAWGEHVAGGSYDSDLLVDLLPILHDFAPRSRGLEAEQVVARVMTDERSRALLRVNEYEGDEYFNRESFRLVTESLLVAGSLLDLVETGVAEGLPNRLAAVRRMEEASGYRVEGLLRRLSASGGPRSGPPADARSDG